MLKQRLLSSAVLVPAFFIGLWFLPSAVLLCFVLFLSTLLLFEFYRVLNMANIPAFRFVGVCCGAAILAATYFGLAWSPGGNIGLARADAWAGMAMAVTVLILMIRQFPQKHNDKPLPTIACTLLGVLYVPFLLSFMVKLAFAGGGIGLGTSLANTPGYFFVIYVAFAAKLTDAGALFLGMAFGRHKLFPRLSPGKTWEGFIGGIATSVVMSLVFFHLVGSERLGGMVVPPSHAVVLGIVLAIAGMMGDLAESLLKRASTLKDSGSSVPGIGGALDIMDSVLFVAPIFYFYVRMMMP
ncbi:MAG: CDP-archaeol synthase [bacterium]